MSTAPSFVLPRWVSPLLIAAACVVVTGCAQEPRALDSAQSSTDNFQKAKAAGMRPVAVGEFTSDDLAVEAQYLKDNLMVELQGAGLLEPGAGAVIQGRVTDVQMGRSSGTVAARFTITLSGSVVYDRELRATSTWSDGSNVRREQSAVYRKLVGLLFTDPGFKNAVPR